MIRVSACFQFDDDMELGGAGLTGATDFEEPENSEG